ncbi:hypothetical protein JCM8202_004376 [Rhodotorula sphaerocarpa]
MGKKSNQARFPLARIKKMIQQDEDVGKVAQATPIVVSKALEMFLASLVTSCVKDAEARGSSKLTPYGLKRAVTATPMLDFCSDLVESIPDPLEGEEDDDASASKKKRGAGVGKKRSAADAETDAGAGTAEGGAAVAAAKPALRKRPAKKAKQDDESDEFDSEADADSDAGEGAGAAVAAQPGKKAPRFDDSEDEDYEEA